MSLLTVVNSISIPSNNFCLEREILTLALEKKMPWKPKVLSTLGRQGFVDPHSLFTASIWLSSDATVCEELAEVTPCIGWAVLWEDDTRCVTGDGCQMCGYSTTFLLCPQGQMWAGETEIGYHPHPWFCFLQFQWPSQQQYKSINRNLLDSLFVLHLFIYVVVGGTCHGTCVEPILSLFHQGSRDQTQAIGLSTEHLYPLSHWSLARNHWFYDALF